MQEKTEKSFVDVVVIDSTFKKRADEVLAVLLGSVEKSSEIQAIQAAGLLEMTEGLASNAKACKDSLNECNESGNGCILRLCDERCFVKRLVQVLPILIIITMRDMGP